MAPKYHDITVRMDGMDTPVTAIDPIRDYICFKYTKGHRHALKTIVSIQIDLSWLLDCSIDKWMVDVVFFIQTICSQPRYCIVACWIESVFGENNIKWLHYGR